MRTLVTRGDSWLRGLLMFLAFASAGFAEGQPLNTLGTQLPPVLVMVARVDPANPDRYFPMFGDEALKAVGLVRMGQRVPIDVPFYMERGDEIETRPGVVAVLRYPIGDVYIDGATRLRIGSLDVLFGRVFARVRGLFSVESQNVVAGVEGTEFAFEVGRNGDADITVVDGAVLCSSRRSPWKPVRVTRGLAFQVSSAGGEFRIARADPNEIAQLQRWVRSVEVVAPPPTAPVPPPPTASPPVSPPPPLFQPQPAPAPTLPAPPPLQPVPIPIPIPIPVPQPSPPAAVPSFWGYCCEAGRVLNTTPEACRGSFHRSQSAAYEQCRPQMSGYCCANGRVYASTPANCQGFFGDERSARRSCATPPPPPPPPQASGYCCAGGQVSRSAQNQCRGSYFIDEASARKSCAPPPQAGYCCAGGRLVETNRASCRGQFYSDQSTAIKLCTTPPPTPSAEQGYCCAGGRVAAATRDRCTGSFYRSQKEAQSACKPIYDAPVQKGIIQRMPVAPKSDAPRVN